ncbi:MAG: hypothetical protein ACREBD_38555, partial [Blastocatellia bacterium]
MWFDGQTFVGKRFYSVNGVLTSRKPGRVDSAIDLNGKFVIPPFAEAHNALLPEIVKYARRAGLRVSTHVESAADFHNAVMAGVDEINHMPGFRGSPKLSLPDPKVYEIAEADARLAGQKGIVVVTTLSGIGTIQETLREQADQLHRRNLNTLKKYRVRVAVGSDEYGSTAAPEAMYLSGLKVFSNLE